ncbi:MAG: sigma-54-dependent Fis family transcriptional regulator [Phycisphaerales bacterium]|nr:MAG: sigma-54-dependent Fis family transcriptional regulator [Phycisphaerales bacterium]
MEQFRPILLEVWQEACRHIQISQSTASIADILARHMPLASVFVRRLDMTRSCLETVAAGPNEAVDGQAHGHAKYSSGQMKRLLAWCRRGEVAIRSADRPLPAALAAAVPDGATGDVLLGPLAGDEGSTGVLVLVSVGPGDFTPRHVEIAKVLLEPFSAALDNDRRVREMAALREAAEADKRSLLTRLGRRQLVDVIVGSDSGLASVMERVDLVARADAPVLILGETGTGKEVIARKIHAGSPRAAGPIMRVNCGAIPPELIDSELFGHERGAFTGATDMRKGWFERADGGTLFLDEIADLPLAAQVRLLRIIQDGWLERVGGEDQIRVDVRIVAATNRDLAGLVSAGKFREDLWYRIAVFPIRLPPVRERREDIPALARHFAERAAIRLSLPVLMPSDDDIALLQAYDWPGNVRELASVLDRAAILGDGRQLEIAKALGIGTAEGIVAVRAPALRAARESAAAHPVLPLDEAMRRHIEAALSMTDGRIEGAGGAAAALEINPHTLRARMRKLGIVWQRFRKPAATEGSRAEGDER